MDGNYLKVYTLKGELVANFEDHIQPITALCVVGCKLTIYLILMVSRVQTQNNDLFSEVLSLVVIARDHFRNY